MKPIYLLLFVLFLSCSGKTHMAKTWKEPNAKIVPGSYKKILIAAMIKDEDTRRMVEDRIVKTNPIFFPSYNVFTSREIMGNVEHCKKVLSEQEFDGIVAVQLVKTDVQEKFVPGTFDTGGYWGYHNYYYPGFYQPGYFREDTSFLIETSVFSLRDNKLLFSGITATTNPKSVEQTVDEVLKEVRREMVKQKILAK
jgi:hypothetical protein